MLPLWSSPIPSHPSQCSRLIRKGQNCPPVVSCAALKGHVSLTTWLTLRSYGGRRGDEDLGKLGKGRQDEAATGAWRMCFPLRANTTLTLSKRKGIWDRDNSLSWSWFWKRWFWTALITEMMWFHLFMTRHPVCSCVCNAVSAQWRVWSASNLHKSK